MISQSLNGAWEFRQAGESKWLPAHVPGGVHTDLLAAGRIPDPFVGQNEKQVAWVADKDWEYRRQFTVDQNLLAQDRVALVCSGLDTLAELELNRQPLGKADNMFRAYRWELKDRLQAGPNELVIRFRSPNAFIAARQKNRPLPYEMNAGMAYLRKAQSHFGWDWGPRLPEMGIWRDIALQGYSTARLADVHLRQQHNQGQVALVVEADCEAWTAAPLALVVTLTAPDGVSTRTVTPLSAVADESLAPLVAAGGAIAPIAAASGAIAPLAEGVTASHTRIAAVIPIADPQLWWPNGSGSQPLYRVEAALLTEDRHLDTQSFQIGLRTLELRRVKDTWGESFTFVVNGRPLFARGANWIPADSFPARLTPERYAFLVGSAAAANMNMLRVWGGGFYEDEVFYDLCDRHGLLVWQDFMFACAAYPLDEEAFLTNLHAEVVDNVRRLRHRACLALWSGNNEIEMMWPQWNRRKHAGLTAALERFFHHLLPEWIEADDREHPYWPSSPSSGPFLIATNSNDAGDTHLWMVWHGMQPFTAYCQANSRFVSEFGFESLPALETIQAFARPDELDLQSPALRHHQRCPAGNEKIIYYLTARFRVPPDFPSLAYVSQVLQAEGVRIGVENWRRNRERCSGALFWQLNDCWPVSSWSSIDSNGHWKALHYMARRFNAPLAVSLEQKGSQVGVFVTNDTPALWEGRLVWSLETLGGKPADGGEEAAVAPALAGTCLRRLDFARYVRQQRRNLVLVVELHQAEQLLERQVALFAPEKSLRLPQPEIAVEVTGKKDELVVTLSSKALARFVALSLPGTQAIFSDNYFDLPAGRPCQVTCPLPAGWSVEQARQALKVRSLADAQPPAPAWPTAWQHFRAGLHPANLFSRILFSFVK